LVLLRVQNKEKQLIFGMEENRCLQILK
jgi:hypothetical protein